VNPSNRTFLRDLSEVQGVTHLLSAFHLEPEAVSIRPWLQKSPAALPPEPLPSYLDKVLSNIRSILHPTLISEMAHHDQIRSRLAVIFKRSNRPQVAKRIQGCRQSHMALRALARSDFQRAHIIPYACNQRSCPACSRQRSHTLFNRIMDHVGPRIEHQPDEYSLRWITFTLRSPRWGSLAPALDALSAAWRAMRRPSHDLWTEAVDGYLFNTEITCNIKARTWHPHLHVVYTGRYLPQRSLDRAWDRRLASRGFHGNAQIGACYVRDSSGSRRTPADDAWSAADVVGCLREVSKYVLKPFETDAVPDSAILELHDELRNRRLTGAGGILATSPPSPEPRWKNVGGIARQLHNRDSLFWTSDSFSSDLIAAATRDQSRWLRLVRSYPHFWRLQLVTERDPPHA